MHVGIGYGNPHLKRKAAAVTRATESLRRISKLGLWEFAWRPFTPDRIGFATVNLPGWEMTTAPGTACERSCEARFACPFRIWSKTTHLLTSENSNFLDVTYQVAAQALLQKLLRARISVFKQKNVHHVVDSSLPSSRLRRLPYSLIPIRLLSPQSRRNSRFFFLTYIHPRRNMRELSRGCHDHILGRPREQMWRPSLIHTQARSLRIASLHNLFCGGNSKRKKRIQQQQQFKPS